MQNQTIQSESVSAGSRVYYFDLRTDSKGNGYVSVTELNKRNNNRSCIYIHPEDFDKFCEALIRTIVNFKNGKEN